MNGLGMLLDDIGDTALMNEWRRAVCASPDADVREQDSEDETGDAATAP